MINKRTIARVFAIFVLFFFLTTHAYAKGGGRQITYAQQNSPGQLVWGSLVERKKDAYVAFTDFRSPKLGERKELVIEKSMLDEIWSSLGSEELAKYEFEPTDSDNMADVGFYTIKLNLKREERNLKIPTDAVEESAKIFIQKISDLLEK